MRTIVIIALSLFIACTINAQHRAHHRKVHKHHQVKRKVAKRHARPAKVRRVAHVKYRALPARGKYVSVVPKGYSLVKFGGVSYHFHKGVWYKPQGKKFVVVKAPRRARVTVLPTGHKRIVVRNKTYFYYYGTFYIQVANSADEYEVVEAPLEAEIDALPQGYEVVNINGQEYYKLDETYYEARINDQDEEYYIVIEKPAN